jgi:hypothetical protein
VIVGILIILLRKGSRALTTQGEWGSLVGFIRTEFPMEGQKAEGV